MIYNSLDYTLHHLSSRFTAGVTAWERKREKQREKGGTQGTGRQRETDAGKGDEEEKKKTCIMQS
ncbi:hypothetical protein F2Y61_14030 [Phocaeicola dorei]|uniref:Uncharacterized protein n=1 Tax=Phocaeicola dorei TaxID=357276 RepID=A0A5M5ZSA3_9BACT|nr:hypothetical protein F2Y61_14030 [Phocaeicola dorei]